MKKLKWREEEAQTSQRWWEHFTFGNKGQAPATAAAAESDEKASAKGAAKGPAKKKAQRPTRREMLALRPLRNPVLEWEEEDDQVVLHIKRENTWKTRLLNIFVPIPNDRRVVLDRVGTHVWRMLDGKTTIDAIAKSLAKEHKITPREAELSLQQYFKELGRRGYVGFMRPEGKDKS